MRASIGKIYILRNPAFKDKLVKIGLTTRASEERAVELSKPTGVPNEFEVLYEEDVFDCHKAERIIHEKLGIYRHNLRREFFDVPLKLAVKTVFETCQFINQSFKTPSRARLAIVVSAELLNKSKLEILRDLLSEYKGDEVDVFLMLINSSSRTTMSLPPANRIVLSPEILNRLKPLDFVAEVVLTKGDAQHSARPVG